MMKDTKAHNGDGADMMKEFKGYTMEELKYQRALTLVKKEFLKEKALRQTMAIKDRLPVVNGSSPLSGIKPSGMVGKLVKGLDFADYIMLGIQAVKIGKKVGSLFRKKKK